MTNEELQNEPKFEDRAEEILKFLEGSDIAGYNILYFDVPMLFEEFHRAGKMFNYRNYRIFDSYRIWTYFEPRTLTGASKRFLGKGIENAHRAKNDVMATRDILHKQMEEWLDMPIEEMVNATTELDKKIDLSGKFAKNEAGDITLTFGKHSGKSVQKIYSEDPEYFRWMYEKAEMPTDTKMIARRIYSKLSE
jgi:DNA polymerase-3 subunit epsilon